MLGGQTRRTRPRQGLIRGSSLGLALLAIGLAAPPAASQVSVTVRVTVERLEALDSLDEPGDADFYAVVTIDGEEFNNEDTPETEALEDEDIINPNWEFSKTVDVSVGAIPVRIEIRDEDGFLRLGDDLIDVTSGGGRILDLTVNLAPCSVSGGLSGSCGTTIVTAGGADDDSAELRFRVVVDEPPGAPGLRVRCSHTPIWPSPSSVISITASALDGALASTIADTIEIYVNDRNTPALASSGATATFSPGPFPLGTFSYGCRVVDDGVPVWTGWRLVAVGVPDTGRAVPVMQTGPRASRIDIVFIADSDSYSAGDAPSFLSDVGSIITGAYHSLDLFLSNEDKFNFWVARDMGDAEPECDHEAPDNWDDDYSFADTGAIVHTDAFRDCAPGGERLFSAEPVELTTFLHETGHRPFGLADEYCCDGGYYQDEPFPNVYEEPEDCADDAPNLGRTSADCREFEETIENWDDFDWSVSDPAVDDLMVDNRTPQANDIRRINWMFDVCRGAGC